MSLYMSTRLACKASLTLNDKNDQHSYNAQSLNNQSLATYSLPYFSFSVIIYLIYLIFSRCF